MKIFSLNANTKLNFKSYYKDENQNKNGNVRYSEAYRVLNDPLIQDSLGICLAQAFAQLKMTGKFDVETFVQRVLQTFGFNIRIQDFTQEIDNVIENNDAKISMLEQCIVDDFKKPKVSAFDERVQNFSDYHKVNMTYVLPELLEAFREMDEKFLNAFPDGIISQTLKLCSDKNPTFLNNSISTHKKVTTLKQMKKAAKSNPQEAQEYHEILNKLFLAQNVMCNLGKIASEFNVEHVEKLFEKNENDRYINAKAMKIFQNWLNSYPESREYYMSLSLIQEIIVN